MSSSSSPLSLALHDGQTLQINVHTSKRARRLRLVSGIHGIHAVVPVNYNADELSSFVEKKRDWLLKTSQYYGRLK